eukprot:105824-Chlamydomonas_euryale.AAC.4
MEAHAHMNDILLEHAGTAVCMWSEVMVLRRITPRCAVPVTAPPMLLIPGCLPRLIQAYQVGCIVPVSRLNVSLCAQMARGRTSKSPRTTPWSRRADAVCLQFRVAAYTKHIPQPKQHAWHHTPH